MRLILISTWLVQTSNIILYSTRWANRGSIALTTFPEMVSQKNRFFEDCSRSNGQILMVAHKSNTTSQGASASVNERSRKNRFGFQFSLQSFFHGEQNVEFAQNLKNLKKIQGILIRINGFVAWAWCRWLLQVIVNT